MSDSTRNYIVAALLALMGLLLLRQQWIAHDRQSQLDANGVTTQGTTLDVRSDKYESVAVVEFAGRNGAVMTRDVPVSKAFANILVREGRERSVQVRYLPYDESVVDIVGASEASRWTAGFVLALFGLAAWVFSRARRGLP